MLTFGERLKKEREKLGFSQTEFGKIVGVEKETQSITRGIKDFLS
ncbi:hypothetical protein [Candidatus Albibeggiatoa sp. nov. BB20]